MSDRKVTYFIDEPLECPVCGESFKQEKMLSGGGRLNADKLTEELRRLYKPTEKFGKVNPLRYIMTVCPNCFYGCYPQDFKQIPSSNLDKLKADIVKRKKYFFDAFGMIDFRQERGEIEGLVSFLAAIYSYAFFPPKVAPTTKIAISALRSAWLAGDLAEEKKDPFYEKVRDSCYRKAAEFYRKSFNFLNNGKENIEAVGNLGPDVDKNYGFNGFLYIYALLLHRYILPGITDDAEKLKLASEAKIVISRTFGSGKSSKDKDVVFLDTAKDLYDKYAKMIKELGGT